MVKIVGIIPARLASVRFPRKVLQPILGKSLLQTTYENTLRCPSLKDLWVATEDQEIVDHVQSFGGHAFLTKEHPSGTDRLAEIAAQSLDKEDIVVNVQADEPCLDPKILDQLIENILDETQERVVTTAVAKITKKSEIFDPARVKCVFDKRQRALYFSRSPIPFPHKERSETDYYVHLGVYCYRAGFLIDYAQMEKTRLQTVEDLEQLRILEHGHPIDVVVVEDQIGGVDTPSDLPKIENYLCQNTSSSQEVLSPLLGRD